MHTYINYTIFLLIQQTTCAGILRVKRVSTLEVAGSDLLQDGYLLPKAGSHTSIHLFRSSKQKHAYVNPFHKQHPSSTLQTDHTTFQRENISAVDWTGFTFSTQQSGAARLFQSKSTRSETAESHSQWLGIDCIPSMTSKNGPFPSVCPQFSSPNMESRSHPGISIKTEADIHIGTRNSDHAARTELFHGRCAFRTVPPIRIPAYSAAQ